MEQISWKKTFSIVFGALIIGLLVYFYFLWNIYLVNNRIEKGNKVLAQQNIQIKKLKTDMGYEKFASIRKLENESKVMPWFDHINKIIDILNTLQSVDASESDSVILTDFNVSLDKISLRWKVSNLNALYYSSTEKWIKSLIDKFEELDFIEKMSIKSYNRADDNYFWFVLETNIINDATK